MIFISFTLKAIKMKKLYQHLLFMAIISIIFAFISLLHVKGDPFSAYGFGFILIQVVLLIVIPFLIGGLPSLIIYLINKKLWNGFFVIIWIVWSLVVIMSVVGQSMNNIANV